MEGDHHAVAGEPGVGLQVPEPQVHGPLECGDGVLGGLVAAATVREGQGPVVSQVRRQIGDGAETSDTGSLLTR